MNTYDFKDSILVGEEGERIITSYLQGLTNIADIRDVRDMDDFQDIDIDLVLKTIEGEIISIEIKTDTYDTGNLFYETYSCIETNSVGCMEKTQADYILYYFTKTNELYILNTAQFRAFVKEKSYNFQKKRLYNVRHDFSKYTSEGYLIPKIYLESSFDGIVKRIIK